MQIDMPPYQSDRKRSITRGLDGVGFWRKLIKNYFSQLDMRSKRPVGFCLLTMRFLDAIAKSAQIGGSNFNGMV